MAINREYLSLITSEYQNSEKFLLWMDSLIARWGENKGASDLINAAFDIDSAVGKQLDTLGVIIGLSRSLRVTIPSVFFSWYDGTPDTEDLGWMMGSWRSPADKDSIEMTILPDDAYRQILKFKIIQNSWKGTVNELYADWNSIFGSEGLSINIIDNQDMTAEITITGSVIPAAIQYILLGNYIPLKPAGVHVSYTFEEGSP